MTVGIDELFRKDVINIENGIRIGTVCDLEADLDKGMIIALYVARSDKAFAPKRSDLIRICWCDIAVIGPETVLVRNVVLPETPSKQTKRIFELFSK